MECRSVIDSLSEYLDGALTATQSAPIESHLNQCPPCRSYKLDLANICIAAKELPLHTPSKAIWARIQNEIEIETTPARKAGAAQSSWWQRWSQKTFTFNLPQLAGAGALAFSLVAFVSYKAIQTNTTPITSGASANVVVQKFDGFVKQRAEKMNLRSASWSPETRAAYQNQLNKIDQSIEGLVAKPDSEQQKQLIDLYEEKLWLMEHYENFK
jgi:Putative zinc-finger